MTIDRDTALKLWDSIYGAGNKWQKDPFGTYIYRDDYGERSSTRVRPNGTGKAYNYGWEVDHIRPKSDFEDENKATFRNNLEPMHHVNNREKADNYPDFTVNGKDYKVVRCDAYNIQSGYGILDVTKNKRVDWKSRR